MQHTHRNHASKIAHHTPRAGNSVQTQLHLARNGYATYEMCCVAEREGLSPECVRTEVALGRMIIPANVHHLELEPMCIGMASKCKVNANLGNSSINSNIERGLDKLNCAVKHGADSVRDLSTDGDIARLRRAMVEISPVPVGTIPLYEARGRVRSVEELSAQVLLEVIQEQAEQGVDYMTIHAGLLAQYISPAKKRITGIVSRGGAILVEWMVKKHKQNFIYEYFEDICKILRKHDVTLSLGHGLRPGCIGNGSEESQFAELATIGELTKKAWEYGVQVMVEGPGHIPLERIALQVKMERELCHEAPFFTLGPPEADVAPDYHHMTSAVGAAVVGWYGASMLGYVTPKEHLGVPNREDLKRGIIGYKIAAHAADVARGRNGGRNRDVESCRARFNIPWRSQFEFSLEPKTPCACDDDSFANERFSNAALGSTGQTNIGSLNRSVERQDAA